jgi:hypothetical protein
MSLFTPSAGRSRAARSVAQVLVREVHVTVLQLFAYVGLIAVLGLGVMEFASSPHLERAAVKLLSSSAIPARADWIASTHEPVLRGRQ